MGEIESRCLGTRTRLLERAIANIFARHLKPTGLRDTQVTLLTAIGAHDGIRPSELSSALLIEKSTVSRTVDKMIEHGWVEALSVPDGRSYEARLTNAGRAKLVEVYPAWSAAQTEVEDLLSNNQHDQLRSIARHITRAVAS